MNFNVVKIEKQHIGNNAFPTYFVDLLNVADRTTVAAKLFNSEEKNAARSFAREYADTNGLRVEDETMVQEAVAAFKARGYVAEAKYKAASDAALMASIISAQ
jgi:hypothetical protein